MNAIHIGAFKYGSYYLGYFRMVHQGENRIVRHKGQDVRFNTEHEAKAAAADAFCNAYNTNMTRDGETLQRPRMTAESLFKGRVTA